MKIQARIEAAIMETLRAHPDVMSVKAGRRIYADLQTKQGGTCVIDIDFDWPDGLPEED